MAINGLVVMTPTSIASTGTGNSSSINADGSVDFSSCATLSLNGVFTSSYDNYMIEIRFVGTGDQRNFLARLRSAGVDASGSNYVRQFLATNGSTIAAARNTALSAFYYTIGDSEYRSGVKSYIFGPFLTQATSLRTIGVAGDQSVRTWDEANTHSLSTSYDGISFITDTAPYTYSGLVTVYGLNQ